MGAADAYMLGHSKIGDAMRRAGLFAAGNLPFMLQNVGGAITRAMDRPYDGGLSFRHAPYD